uniref:Uncharacterized protein n=1 Tax=Clostridium botulinum TaxID=1491 RepID=A0A126JHQ2_CLOBO|nr:hypothetical protein [Clostridium botulinum]
MRLDGAFFSFVLNLTLIPLMLICKLNSQLLELLFNDLLINIYSINTTDTINMPIIINTTTLQLLF